MYVSAKTDKEEEDGEEGLEIKEGGLRGGTHNTQRQRKIRKG